MYYQGLTTSKTSVTYLTFMIFFMDYLMALETGLRVKYFLAYLTFISWFFGLIHSFLNKRYHFTNERQREKERHRERKREKERHRERTREKQSYGQRRRERKRGMERETELHTETQNVREKEIERRERELEK